MANVTYPGVYMQEVSSGVRPIQTAGTSTAAFIGLAEKGPISGATKVYNFTQYQNQFGGFTKYSYLSHAVYQFFNNGGGECYIVRVAGADAANASLTLNDRATGGAQPTLLLMAQSPGEWANRLGIVITDGTRDPANEFNLYIFEEGRDAPLESFENLSMNPAAPNAASSALNVSQLLRLSLLDNANAIKGYSRSADAIPSDLIPAGETRNLRVNIDEDGWQEIAVTGTTPAEVAGAIQTAITALSPRRSSTEPVAYSGFTATIDSDGKLLLQSGSQKAASSVQVMPAAEMDASGLLRLGVNRQGVEIRGASVLRPPANVTTNGRVAPENYYHVGDHAPDAVVPAVTAGRSGESSVTETRYIDAFHRLDDIDDVSLIAVPGACTELIAGAGVGYCANRPLQDAFFIADMHEHEDTVEEAQAFMAAISPKNSYGAVYTPWALMPDPIGSGSIAVPPSGFVAGLYAQTDARRGVWKAPAGTAAGLSGASGLIKNFTDPEQGNLNPKNINVLRSFPGAGLVLWGARTIAADPEFGYVPVRRTAIMLRKSIYAGIQWAVF